MQTTLVKLGSFEIPVIEVEGRRYVAVHQVCDVLGIDRTGQQQKLHALPWANTEKMKVGGVGQPKIVVPFGVLPLWLDTIHTGMIAEHARPRLAELKVAVEAYLSGKTDKPVAGTALAVIEPEPTIIDEVADLAVFQFDANPIRVVTMGDEPWWVAKDLCCVLGIADHHQAVESLDNDEVRGGCTVPTPGGPQPMLCVNESGLYSLIFKSRKPDARRFRKWVTSEVLPSIRKSGDYSTSPAPTTDDPIEAMLLATLETHRTVRRLQADHSRFDSRLNALENAFAEFGASQDGYLTTLGYSLLHKLDLDDQSQNRLGRVASRLCREQGITPRRVPHPRFKSVGAYPPNLLANAMTLLDD